MGALVQLNSQWEMRVELRSSFSLITITETTGAIAWSLRVEATNANGDYRLEELGRLPEIRNVPMTRMLWTNVGEEGSSNMTVVLNHGKLRVLISDKVACRYNIRK